MAEALKIDISNLRDEHSNQLLDIDNQHQNSIESLKKEQKFEISNLRRSLQETENELNQVKLEQIDFKEKNARLQLNLQQMSNGLINRINKYCDL